MNCGGSHPTYECPERVSYVTPSGHQFCFAHGIEHEAEVFAGLTKRVVEDHDYYLLPEVAAAAERLAQLTGEAVR